MGASVHKSHIETAYAIPGSNRKKKYKCSYCNANFTQNGCLKKHEYEVHKLVTQGNYVRDGKKCPICNKTFSNRSILKLHITSVHESKIPHKCIYVHEKKHITSVHGVQKPITCTICNNENNYGSQILPLMYLN